MTENVIISPGDKQSKDALEVGIQALYAHLIASDYTTQGHYLSTMIDLVDQWLLLREKINNCEGRYGWITEQFKHISRNIVSSEREIAYRMHRRDPESQEEINKYYRTIQAKFSEVILKFTTFDEDERKFAMLTAADRSDIIRAQSLNPNLISARAAAVYVDKQEQLIWCTAQIMRCITAIVIRNQLVCISNQTFAKPIDGWATDKKPEQPKPEVQTNPQKLSGYSRGV